MIPGFVRLSVTGEQRERFLNLCKSRGIMFGESFRQEKKNFC